MNELETKQAIAASLKSFADKPLAAAAAALFESLGYRSEKRFTIKPNTPETFGTMFAKEKPFHPGHTMLADWQSVDLLFQLTDEEVRAATGGDQEFLFESKGKWNGAEMDSYLFFAITLAKSHYSRTELSGITRALNRLFPMPVMLLFRHGDTLTLAIINRRLHMLDSSKDVLEKVTLIKDIRVIEPHRAHVEILCDLSFGSLRERHDISNFVTLHAAWQKSLDSSELNKRFFLEVGNWYFWAIKYAKFPKDAPKQEGKDHISVIGLITRLMFVWFIKEKRLVPDDLFDERKLHQILNGFSPTKIGDKESVFYRAILQNLFFATLNTEMDKRGWTKEEQNFMAHSLYRFRECFQKPDEALGLFKNIPFLNGGLFECLDKDLGENSKPRYERIDGFSRRTDSQPVVPDFLFFGPERDVDLSADYGDDKFKKVKVRGLIHTLNHYKFTVAENTPIEEEIALDPELAGKVFENLLAAYNPQTGATARKQTGSFYTPREIVYYMVDEGLTAHLKNHLEAALPLAKDIDVRLRHLFSYSNESHTFNAPEVDALIAAIDSLKSLDPAVGSGAFPMGILHKLVFILGKLDSRNEKWKERQISRVRDAMATAEKIEDAAIRECAIRELEKQIAGINEAFEQNELDYGRKLYLIENCIYGVDIQPIAVQIAKMRFFISLIVDQRIDRKARNLGIRPLPNLETKFVAANTLIGIEKPDQQMLRNAQIDAKEKELKEVRDNHFSARTPQTKAKWRSADAKLRAEISELLRADGFSRETTQRLANWNPYDQNLSADFFDSEWMFSVNEGFDIAIGNPPYLESRSPAFTDSLKSQLQEAVSSRWSNTNVADCVPRGSDLLIYFLETAVHMVKQSGSVVLITQNAWLDTEYGKKFQNFILRKTHVSLIVDSDFKHFDNAGGPNINTVITIFQGKKPMPEKFMTFVRFHKSLQSGYFSACGERIVHAPTGSDYRQYSYSDKALRDTKWGLLLSLDDVVLDLLSKLQEKAKLIEELRHCRLSVGQGLNLTNNYYVSPYLVKQMPFLRKALVPIHTVADGALFDILRTEMHLVNARKLDKDETRTLRSGAIRPFDPDSTSKRPPILIMPRGIGRYFCALNSAKAFSSSGVDVYSDDDRCDEKTLYNLWAILNSSVAWLLREATGRKNLGGGMLKAEAVDLKSIPLYIDIDAIGEIKALAKALSARQAYDSILELDSKEHKQLDELVFNRLNADADEKQQIVNSLRRKIAARTHKSKT